MKGGGYGIIRYIRFWHLDVKIEEDSGFFPVKISLHCITTGVPTKKVRVVITMYLKYPIRTSTGSSVVPRCWPFSVL